MEEAPLGFRIIYKIWQIMKCFAGTFSLSANFEIVKSAAAAMIPMLDGYGENLRQIPRLEVSVTEIFFSKV